MDEAQEIIIFGAGEQAEIAYEYFTLDSSYEVVGFAVDPEFATKESFNGLPVTTTEKVAEQFPPARCRAFVAISATKLNRDRERLFLRAKEMGYELVSYVSSRAFVWTNVKIGENAFIFENNVVQHKAIISDNVVLWSGNHVGHRTKIEDHCFIASHVVISGYCRIGKYSYLGVNSCLRDGVSLAQDTVIGAGAVVVKDTEPNNVYVGNPAKPTGRSGLDTFALAKPEETT